MNCLLNDPIHYAAFISIIYYRKAIIILGFSSINVIRNNLRKFYLKINVNTLILELLIVFIF